MNREDVAGQLSRTDAGLVAGAIFKTVGNARSIVQALLYLVENTPAAGTPVVELGAADRGGIWVPGPGMDIDHWMAQRSMNPTLKDFQRKVIVVEDWTEVTT